MGQQEGGGAVVGPRRAQGGEGTGTARSGGVDGDGADGALRQVQRQLPGREDYTARIY